MLNILQVSVLAQIVALAHAALVPEPRPLELQVLADNSPSPKICQVVTLRHTQKVRGITQDAVHISHASAMQDGERYSFVGHNERNLWEAAQEVCGKDWEVQGSLAGWTNINDVQQVLETRLLPPAPHLRIEPLIQSGPSDNRVDLVFFSDGYLKEEHDKFIEDARRLAEDVSYNQTFNTVRPLLNFWAAFTPSNESGIGVGGKPKNTTYGLYRDGTELRGVYYSKPAVARAACLSMGDQCDYPILMGNDPLYGGLGGEFTVITPSLANGPLVLRHELGHSVIDVGEEYDGGFAYFGVNAADNRSTPVSWEHWLTNPPSDQELEADGKARAERSVMPIQAYPWTLLNTSSSWAINFTASGLYSRHVVRFSLSGLPEASDLTVEIDGSDLDWVPRQDIGVDRWHYDIHRDGGLSDDIHEVKFILNNPEREGIAQMCSVEVLEFGNEQQFNATPGHYSLYPTFSLANETTYRPTNEDCLMRIVTTPNFCKVCLEGLWHSLLRRVNLIDNVEVGCSELDRRTVSLSLVPLAEFRTDAVVASESYSIMWFKDGRVLDAFTNTTALDLDDREALGHYTVDVQFSTEEVRVDKDNLLFSRSDFDIADRCSSYVLNED